ncbi:hypothetical protein A2567_01425 [Candidatus Azambacteria bacterium RIFOXYD1_FULL_42_11]|uniref:Uncharacterized protein n=3 Tax=Candidatus Azamiibacteriota TaxID=1752741 RepID=A0A1F5CHI9_9BACT|nr:MAG: hypothetical protein UV07_C0012G0009 [Candidatus Azambacteria bacterium GW2011_GWB1_42_17]KKS75437.1 MAG: hypothetical protein UV48_C0012G0009 [Candidatus Azambacteria bacterium GW2011_GWA2_42_9]KKS88088.1 MAG: hypothetical protein UV62_C0015G0009 [Parcubacteria group bacterium GW2011_GWC1_43_11]OGD42312.1 MAG: hypothetical protein A2567_01425 [Candidatus Azambacteria bacterium RIFOXYD1_FULL_42_11]
MIYNDKFGNILLMNDELKDVLKKQEETLILVEKLWRAEKWRRFWAIFRYVIYIGIILGAFYFLTPYVEKLIGIIQGIQGAQNPQDLQKILEQLQ